MFNNIYGNYYPKKLIESLIKKDRIVHTIIINGENGLGKLTFAKNIASQIVYNQPYTQNINNYIDINIINGNDTGSILINNIREIKNSINNTPHEGKKKVQIIANCDKMTIQAQNALLKTIEEPPNGVYILLLTTSLESLLDTIKSRCQIYKLTPLNKEEMINFINLNYEVSEKQISSLLAYSEGIPGRVEKFLNDHKLQSLRNLIIDMLKDINKNEVDITLKYEKLFYHYKDEKEELLNIISSFVRDIILYKEIDDKRLIINSDKNKDIEELVQMMSYRKLNGMLKYIDEARTNLKQNINFSMTISIMLMGFLEV